MSLFLTPQRLFFWWPQTAFCPVSAPWMSSTVLPLPWKSQATIPQARIPISQWWWKQRSESSQPNPTFRTYARWMTTRLHCILHQTHCSSFRKKTEKIISPKSKQQQEDRQTDEACGYCFSINDRKKRTAQHNRESYVRNKRDRKRKRPRERKRERGKERGLQEELQTINMLILLIFHSFLKSSYVVYEADLQYWWSTKIWFPFT